MDAVVKIGGSLAAEPRFLRAICSTFGSLEERWEIVVVPGGGEFADVVREIDRRYSLNPSVAHRMAILGMDQYGFLLSNLIPNSLTVQTIVEALGARQSGRTIIFLPFKSMCEEDPLEACWDVTSDSITACISSRLRSKKLILVTDVDGIFTSDPKKDPKAKLVRTVSASELIKQNERTCVDKLLPKILESSKQACFIVNGKYPGRIERILADKPTICTRILAE
jgi:hypothetical protein